MNKLFFLDNHILISGLFVIVIFSIKFVIKNTKILNKILFFSLIINFISYYLVLMINNSFDFRTHLPIHLCYITELGILISFILKNKTFYPVLALNSLGGGISGLTNSNLVVSSYWIEFFHLYLSHTNLIFFFIILYKEKFTINKKMFSISILINALIFCFAFVFNKMFGSNYWFTASKPEGKNLTLLFSDWPDYLIGLIVIGLFSYLVTYMILKKNKSI
ncbi:MAG: hypothetical protein CMG49_04815 [Candidatus Marinimicrobia bacterium]|nr:hypothetical protein [Candidatus Neomarinimicrobiota bacterium]